jgi:hypothetical protein
MIVINSQASTVSRTSGSRFSVSDLALKPLIAAIAVSSLSVVLAGCGDGNGAMANVSGDSSYSPPVEEDSAPVSVPPAPTKTPVPAPSTPAPVTPVPVAPANHAPSISGSATKTGIAGNAYTFAPVAADADGDSLAFTVTNKPVWASFNTSNGVLSGTPSPADIGSFNNIVIAVSDGKTQKALAAFTLQILPVATGSTTLSWGAPMQNADGSALTNLAGYRIYYGTSADAMTHVAAINNPSLTRYVVENLSSATWYFSITTVNSTGKESQVSSVISVTIS